MTAQTLAIHRSQVSVLALFACLSEQAMDQTAMMGLVIDEMHEQQRPRHAEVLFSCTRVPSGVALRSSGVKPAGPVNDRRVESGALAFEVGPVIVERHCWWVGRSTATARSSSS